MDRKKGLSFLIGYRLSENDLSSSPDLFRCQPLSNKLPRSTASSSSQFNSIRLGFANRSRDEQNLPAYLMELLDELNDRTPYGFSLQSWNCYSERVTAALLFQSTSAGRRDSKL
jgi:hypothetical protein